MPEVALRESEATQGEFVSISEKVVISPADGRFEPLPPEIFTSEGEWVEVGQRLALIRTLDTSIEVVSCFRGWLMGMLCVPGQPVKAREGLFWIR